MSDYDLTVLASMHPIDDAPDIAGVYVLGERGKRVWYVGQSKNIAKRTDQHRRSRELPDLKSLIKQTAPAVLVFSQEDCENATGCKGVTARRCIESMLIEAFNPVFNTRGRLAHARGEAIYDCKIGKVSKNLALLVNLQLPSSSSYLVVESIA